MIELREDWVVFSGEDAVKFEPKRAGDEFKNTFLMESPWYTFTSDISNGYLTFECDSRSFYRRPLRNCTEAELNLVATPPDEEGHFI